MAASPQLSTPALSRSSSSSSAKSSKKSSLRLVLSDLPPLIAPSPPSNTLLITNLAEPEIFHVTNLTQLRDLVNQTAPIHTWAPLKSFRRIVVSFFDIDAAINIKQQLDGTAIMGCRIRVFFGEPTPTTVKDQHLQAPKSDKLFFISPPPSPPHGWEMRNEEPPNKQVHAEDLAAALAKLHARAPAEINSPEEMQVESTRKPGANRQRSGSSTYVYCPEDHGDSADLPAIAVEDTTESPGQMSPMEGVERKFLHTSRPPVELMEH